MGWSARELNVFTLGNESGRFITHVFLLNFHSEYFHCYKFHFLIDELLIQKTKAYGLQWL